MLPRLLLTATFIVGAGLVSAQEGGGAPSGPLTPFEQIAAKLKLDLDKQIPAAETIFTEAARSAAPVAQEMVLLRRRLLDAELNGKTADITPILNTYRGSAAKMTGLEVQTYGKLFATLKPNQQSKTTEAFPWVAGILQPPPPRGGRGQRRTGGGL